MADTQTDGVALIEELRLLFKKDGFHALDLNGSDQESIPVALLRQMRQLLPILAFDARSDQAANRALLAVVGFASAFRHRCPDIEMDDSLEAEAGLADNGNLTADLPVLLELLGLAAREARMPIALFMQDLETLEVVQQQSILLAVHRIAQKSLPIMMLASGSPRLPRLLGQRYPDVERLFQFMDLAHTERAPFGRAA